MKDILILASYGDIHAAAVQWALERAGESPKLWYGCEFPARQVASITLGETAHDARLADEDGALFHSGGVKTVWNRRPHRPQVPAGVHPADAPVVDVECRRMASALLLEMEADAFWCNAAHPAARANDKPLQLAQARAVGLAIPETLFSNDPDAIRAFHARHGGNVIFKPFLQPQWLKASTTYSYFTSVLPASALEHGNSLRHCPGIYQPRIDKRHEVRVTMVGRHVFATRIDSQASRLSTLDWRQDLLQQCPLSESTLPPALVERCHALMARLGLVFGCMDFIVTPDGDYVFLEINEMGQFLWIEERCPSTRLLDAFTQMLIQGRPDFDWRPGARPDVSYGAFLASDACERFLVASDTDRPWQMQAVLEH